MHTPTFAAALAAYTRAVQDCTHWEGHGTHGDGNLEAAQAAQKSARQLVFQAARAMR
jgi:hypothetical protein